MKRQSSEEEMLRAIARLGNASFEDEDDDSKKDSKKRNKKKNGAKTASDGDDETKMVEESEIEEDDVDDDDDDDEDDDSDEAAKAILQLAHGNFEEEDEGDDDDDEGIDKPPKKKKKEEIDDAEAARIALQQKEEKLKYRSHAFKLQLEALLTEQKIDYDANGGASKDMTDLKRALTKAVCSTVPSWKTSTRLIATGSFSMRTAVIGSVVDISVVVPPGWITAERHINTWTMGLAEALKKQLPKVSGLAWVGSVRTQKYYGDFMTLLLEPKQSEEKSSHRTLRIIPVERADSHNSAESFIKRALEQCKSLRDTIQLVKIWMNQRGMLNADQPDSLGGFATTLLLSGIAMSSPATQEMTSYQLFHHFLKVLATPSPASKKYIPEHMTIAQKKQLEQLSPLSSRTSAGGFFIGDKTKSSLSSSSVPAVLMSPDGRTNYAAHMTESSLDELTFFARLSLSQLEANHTVESGFPELFLKPVQPHLLYDVLVSFPPSSAKGDKDVLLKKTIDVLRAGLDDRCFLIRPVVTPETLEGKLLIVGLVLNPETAFRQVQKGSPADNEEESRKFRALWGVKAEVRSFQDTSVMNCVVFEAPESQRHGIVREMVLFLLEHNIGIHRANMQVTGTELDIALPGGDEQQTARLVRDFDSLAKRLCAMELPLRIREVVPACPALRHTSVCVPKPIIRGLTESDFEETYVPALHGVIHFEGSSAWPEDIEAFRGVKTALLVAIADVLRNKYLIDAFPYSDHIDIVFKGSVFSLSVHHPREAALLQRAGKRVEALEHARELTYKPIHHGVIRSVGMKHYVYNRTVRVAKRWICSHMLSSQISEEAIELLVARVFTQSSPLPPPQSVVAGFARFLSLLDSLRNADPSAPVIVDTNSDMSEEEYAKLQAIHQVPGSRQYCPLMIVTPRSRGHSFWTSPKKPGAVGLKRIISVAEASLSFLTKLVLTGATPDSEQSTSSAWKVLFNPPLEPYSFTVHLRLEKLTRLADNLDWHIPVWAHRLIRDRSDRIEKRQKNPTRLGEPLTKAPLVEFDPAEYFCRELEEMLGRNALVFHNSLGGNVIGVVWNPTAFTPRRWNGQHPETSSSNMMPISDVTSTEARQFALNIQQILADVRVIGSGIIYDVRKQGQPAPTQEDPSSSSSSSS